MLKNNGFHNRHSPLPFSPLFLFSGGAPGAWYDPSNFSTLFQDSAGTTPVTAVEQPVGRILDISGNGNHAFQTISADRPVLKIDGNGKYYLFFDGISDSLSTNSISFTSTNKMSVFSGVRKLTDAVQMLFELSAVVDVNNGSWNLFNLSTKFTTDSRGTASSRTVIAATPVAPSTTVVSLLKDIAGDVNSGRINAGTFSTDSADQGTGNYGNYPLYIGGRAGASLLFNGNLYSLIVVGKAVTAAELASTETWVNGKTGAY